jgi:predicted RNA-binding Zn ribbon-like protein
MDSSSKKLFDGPKFLFLGGHAAVDLANTLVPPPGLNVEFLRTWGDVIHWLGRANLSTSPALNLPEERCPLALKSFVKFRDRWRNELSQIVTNGKVSDVFLQELNQILNSDPFTETLTRNHKAGFRIARSSSQLHGEKLALALVSHQIAGFLAEANPDYIRRCANTASCVLYFYDTTKNHHRQWCSTASCGNRHKVAAFRKRAAKGNGKTKAIAAHEKTGTQQNKLFGNFPTAKSIPATSVKPSPAT